MVDEQVDVPSGRSSGRAWRGRLSGVAVAVVVAGWGLWQPGSAAVAATAGVTLQYTCSFFQSMTAQLVWTAPPEVVVGEPTPAATVTAAATISAADTAPLRFDGVASVDGSGDVADAVVAPEGTIHTALHLVVSPTPVPSSGPMTFHATGTLSGLVFHQPGHAIVDVGTALDLVLTPRGANGNPIVGPVSVSCTLNHGQDPEVFSFDIMPAPLPPRTPTTTRPVPPPAVAGVGGAGTPGAGLSGGSSGSGAAGAGGSSTASPAVSSGAPPTTLTPASVTATRGPVRDSAVMANRSRLPADWWLPVGSTMIVVVGVVGGVRWLQNRRRRVPGGGSSMPDDL